VYKTNFSPLLEHIESADLITIGAAATEKEHFDNKTNFQGQINHFHILPIELSEKNISHDPRDATMLKESSPKSSPTSMQDKELENLYEISILNLHAFVRISKLNVHDEIIWSNPYNSKSIQKKKKSLLDTTMSLFSKSKQDLNSDDAEKLEIRSQGVFYLEKSKFVDLLFSIGDVDIFIMCIALLINFRKLDQKLG